MMFVISLFAVLAACIYIKADPHESSLNIKLVRVIPLGEAYASSTINVSIFRQSAVLTTPKGQFVAFYDAKGDVRVLALNKRGITKTYTVLPKLTGRLIQDGHCAINLGYSSDGVLHVIYEAHGTKPYYAPISLDKIGPEPYHDIHATIWEETITYPQFYDVDGNLWLMYRHLPNIYVKIYDAKKQSFEPAYKTPLLSYTGLVNQKGASIYIDRMAVRENNLALFWAYRIPPVKAQDKEENCFVVNDGIYFARSNDGGESWVSASGERLSLPISYERINNAGKAIDISHSAGLVNQNSSVLGADDRVYEVHQSKDSDGIPQIFLTVFGKDNSIILKEAVSINKDHFNLLGKGTLLLPLSRADVAVSSKMVHVIYRQEDRLIIASKLLKNIDGPWQYFSPKTIPLVGWEPNYDLEAWNKEQKLVIYVQGARQGRSDYGVEGPPSPCYLYEFVESK